jgi:hypothetical protein
MRLLINAHRTAVSAIAIMLNASAGLKMIAEGPIRSDFGSRPGRIPGGTRRVGGTGEVGNEG